MANKKITLDVEVLTNLPASLGNLRQLKKALKEFEAGSESFKKVKAAANDMEDAIKSAKTGADSFVEIIGALPGPVGELGGKVAGSINVLKQFGGIKFDALKNSFSELGKDVGDIFKGFGQLTGITKVYTTISNGLSTAFKAVGVSEGIASAGARGFAAALTATGIGALVVLLGTLVANFDKVGDALMKMIPGLKEVGKWVGNLYDKFTDFLGLTSQAERDLEKQKKITDRKKEDLENQIKILEAAGGKEQEVYNLKKQIKENELNDLRNTLKVKKALTEEEQKQFRDAKAELATLDAAEAKRLKDKKDKEAADAAASAKKISDANKAAKKKDDEEKLENIKAAGKAETDAYKDTLSARDKELYEAGQLTNERLAAIDKAGTGDRSIILEAYRKKMQEINDKYDKEDADKEKEKAKKKADEQREATVTALEGLISDLDYKNQLLDYDFADDLDRLQQKKDLQIQERDALLSNEELTAAERLKIIQDYAQKDRDVEADITNTKKAEAQSRLAIQMQYADYIQQFGNLLQSVAGKNKGLAIAGIVIEQGAALAKVLMQTSAANIAATAAAAPFIANPVTAIPATANLARTITMNNIQGALSAAGIVVAAVKGIQTINQANVGTQSSGGGGSASAAAPAPSYTGGAVSMAAPQLQLQQQASPGQQIAQTISAASGKPIKAYVVSNDITSQQQMDRRTNRAATFSLG